MSLEPRLRLAINTMAVSIDRILAEAQPSIYLYGSVTAKDIAEQLKKALSVDIDKRKILLKDPIKAYGNYTIDIKLMPEVTATFTVRVIN